MKRSLSKKHADLLKQCYMGAGMDHDVMLGVQNRKVEVYDLLAQIYTQVNIPHMAGCGHESHHFCHCANS